MSFLLLGIQRMHNS